MKKYLAAVGVAAIAGALAVPCVAAAAPGHAVGVSGKGTSAEALARTDPGTIPHGSPPASVAPPVVTPPGGLPGEGIPADPAETPTSPSAAPTSAPVHGSPPASSTPPVVTLPPGLPGEGVPDDPAVETTAPATAPPTSATAVPAEATGAPVDAITDSPIETTVAPAPPAQEAPPAGGSGGGGLAHTGSNLALPVGVGVVLVAAGIAGVLFARRRKQFVA